MVALHGSISEKMRIGRVIALLAAAARACGGACGWEFEQPVNGSRVLASEAEAEGLVVLAHSHCDHGEAAPPVAASWTVHSKGVRTGFGPDMGLRSGSALRAPIRHPGEYCFGATSHADRNSASTVCVHVDRTFNLRSALSVEPGYSEPGPVHIAHVGAIGERFSVAHPLCTPVPCDATLFEPLFSHHDVSPPTPHTGVRRWVVLPYAVGASRAERVFYVLAIVGTELPPS